MDALVGDRAVRLGRRQERKLLAILALTPGQYVLTDRLSCLLWPARPPEHVRTGLQAMVSHLRAATRAAKGASLPLEACRGGYALHIDRRDVDIHHVRSLIDEGQATTDAYARMRALGEALRLWRGQPLCDVADDDERVRLCPDAEELYVAAREGVLEARIDLGEGRTTIAPLTALVSANPLREHPVELSMIALHRSGRTSDALDLYAQFAARLAGTLGLDPTENLRRLRVSILRDEPSVAARPAADDHAVTVAPATMPSSRSALTPPPAATHRCAPRREGQASLLIASDLAYRRLPAPARRVFRALGLLPGLTLTPEAAAAVTATSLVSAARELTRLHAAQVVVSDRHGRYAIHDSLLRFASHRGVTRTADIGRLFDWYLAHASAAASLLHPDVFRLDCGASRIAFGDHAAAGAWLNTERATMIGLVVWGARNEAYRSAALLADQLHGYLRVRPHHTDWVTIGQAGLAAAVASGDPRLAAALHLNLGAARLRALQPVAARALLRRALRLFGKVGDRDGRRTAIAALGTLHASTGELPRAIRYLEHSVAIAARTALADGQCGLGHGRLSDVVELHDRAVWVDDLPEQPTVP